MTDTLTETKKDGCQCGCGDTVEPIKAPDATTTDGGCNCGCGTPVS